MKNSKIYVKKIISVFLILPLFVLLCACAPDGSTENGDGVTFTDALGREVCVQKNPARVAAMLGSFADVWMLSGGQICATVEDAWDDFELDLPDAVNIGGAHSPNLELLL